MISELMNMSPTEQTAFVTITYEYIPSPPSSFNKVVPVWLDIGGCLSSEMPAKSNTTFDYISPAWTSNITGQITSIGAHLHDGGSHLSILSNNSTLVCDYVAGYGETPGYIDGANMNMSSMGGMPGMPGMPGMDTTHLSSVSGCLTSRIQAGDVWTVDAFYNMTAHAPMYSNDGTLAPIMGIAIFYVAVGEPLTNTTSNGTAGGNPTATGTGTTTPSATTKPSSASKATAVSVVALLTAFVAAALL